MPTTIKTANFGKTKAGLLTVGYTLFGSAGSVISPRTTSGVYEVGSTTGIYGAEITIPESFSGTILWDTGNGGSTVYASEEINYTDSAAFLSADLEFVKDMIGGRWVIDHDNFQMIFYKHDNSTEVARFDLRDKNNDPSYLSVFHRKRET